MVILFIRTGALSVIISFGIRCLGMKLPTKAPAAVSAAVLSKGYASIELDKSHCQVSIYLWSLLVL